jgi:hypothetical protein
MYRNAAKTQIVKVVGLAVQRYDLGCVRRKSLSATSGESRELEKAHADQPQPFEGYVTGEYIGTPG